MGFLLCFQNQKGKDQKDSQDNYQVDLLIELKNMSIQTFDRVLVKDVNVEIEALD